LLLPFTVIVDDLHGWEPLQGNEEKANYCMLLLR